MDTHSLDRNIFKFTDVVWFNIILFSQRVYGIIDPNQTPYSILGLHFLPRSLFLNERLKAWMSFSFFPANYIGKTKQKMNK